MSDREKRMLLLLAPAVVLILIIRFGFMREKTHEVVSSGGSAPLAEKRLAKLRQVAATVPAKEEVLKRVDAEMALREKGILTAETGPQATAHLMELARTVGKAENIEIRGGELGQTKVLSPEYGEVTAGISFDCHIDQFVNFMAGLSREAELIGTRDIRITAGNPKEKTIVVRMTLGGLVPKKLIPEKKGFASF
jgi:hypothetical protein